MTLATCVTLATSRYPYENTTLDGLPAVLDLPADTVAFWGTSSGIKFSG